jgi:hypothetical protein
MKFYLPFPVALVLLVPIWATACGVQPTAMLPTEEAVTAQAGQATNDEEPTTAQERVVPSTPTSEVQKEEASVSPIPTPEVTEAEPPEEAKPAVRLAREDLVGRLDLAPEAVRLVSAEAVEWSDASLGCPQPGMMYAQVITPGFLVIFEAGGEEFAYHTDRENHVVLCQPQEGGEEAGLPAKAALSTGEEQVVRLAIEDVALKLGLAPEAIRLVSVEAVDWPDTSLGCPQSGIHYAQVIVPGYRVVMKADDEVYEHHSGRGQEVLCDREGHLISVLPSLTGTAMAVPRVPTILSGEIVPTPVSGNLRKLIDVAKQDLARRLEITPDEIEVVHIENAEWPDTSLGCGKPGLARRPVAIPGYRVILSARGHEYVYHTGRESGVVYCPKG